MDAPCDADVLRLQAPHGIRAATAARGGVAHIVLATMVGAD
jgi:hypothetical protein